MRSLDDLLAPITPEQFRAEHEGRKPLHIPAQAGTTKRDLLSWETFNGLLGQTAIWDPVNFRMVRDGEPIPPEQYGFIAAGTNVLRPQANRVKALVASGASIIANDVHTLTPDLHAVAIALSRTFAASVGANVYCSFEGVQAFNTHYDLHDVFAVQTEGEKVWRLYANRADAPVEFPDDVDMVQEMQRTRGPLMQEVRMRPGDVLYLPRGWHHDALATDGASLHVTYSVAPLYGRILFRLLESAAMQDPAFRAWLAPAWLDGSETLAAQVKDLGRRLQTLAAMPEFVDEVAMAQQQLVQRPADHGLPRRIELTRYRPTGLLPAMPTGPARIAMDWALSQPDFVLEEMVGRFDFIAEPAIRDMIAAAERGGAFKRL